MRNRMPAIALLLAFVFALYGCAGRAAGRTHRIEIAAMVFAPAELTVAPGDTVVWVNHDIVAHTVTAEGRRFDSGSLSPSAEWSWLVTEPGRISYACTFHPVMKAVLIVK